jgi:hypothetical protein
VRAGQHKSESQLLFLWTSKLLAGKLLSYYILLCVAFRNIECVVPVAQQLEE